MWKLAAEVIERFSGLTPMKAFFRYIFKRVSNDFLDHEPAMDFRKGQLELLNLPLSAHKINQTFLMSSPYIMHSGTIQKLKISLPNLTQIASKSIEVEVSGLELVFYPNKHFLERFNEQMQQIKENSKFYDVNQQVRETIDFKEDDEMDFFKEIIKQIMTNIRVQINNISVKVYMNTPSDQKKPKPQFFSMLRIPSIIIQRNRQQDQSTENRDTQKYELRIPQISTHLLRHDAKLLEYSNIKATKADSPFKMPTVDHPSCIMLIGNSDTSQGDQSIVFELTIKRQLKTRKKKFQIKGVVPNIQFMVEPFQIKVIQKFIQQLEQFRSLYQNSMQELRNDDKQLFDKFNDVSRDFSIKDSGSIKFSGDIHTSMDIFSSMAMAFEDIPKRQNKPQRQSYFASIMEDNSKESKQLRENLTDFNKQVTKEVRQKLKGNIDTDFSTVVQVKVDIHFIRLYVLKHNCCTTSVDYRRAWTMVNKKKPELNDRIPGSYFVFNILNLSVEAEDTKTMSVRIKKVNLMNVKLANQDSPEKLQESDVFHSFDTNNDSPFTMSVEYEAQKSSCAKQLVKALATFEKLPSQHYCANYIFWISSADPKPRKTKTFGKIYCVNREQSQTQKNIFDVGITIDLSKGKSKQSQLSVFIKRVGVFMDSEVVKDLVNIVYPLFTYRGMIDAINLMRQEAEPMAERNSRASGRASLNYSSYDVFAPPQARESYQQPKKAKSQTVTEISVGNLSIGFSDIRLSQSDLVHNQKKKMEDGESFVSGCFCHYKSECLGIDVEKFKSRSTYKEKIIFRNFQAWVKTIDSTEAPIKTVILSTPGEVLDNRVFIGYSKDNSQVQTKINIHIPHLKIDVAKKECLRVIRMLQKIGLSYKSLLSYSRHLKSQFRRIDQSNQEGTPKRPQKAAADKMLVFHVGKVQASVLDVELYLSDLLFSTEPKQTLLKVNSILLLHLHKTRPLLKSVPIESKTYIPYLNKQVYTSSIVLQLFAKEGQNVFQPETKDQDFFNKVESQAYSMVVNISRNQQKIEQNFKTTDLKNSRKFEFMKRRQLEIISEQENQKVVSLTVSESLVIRVCEAKNFMYLKEDVKEIQQLVELCMITQLFDASTSHPRRKDSELPPERKSELYLRIKQLSIDVFPYQDLRQSTQVLALTRSYISLETLNIQLSSAEVCDENGYPQKSNNISLQLKNAQIWFLYFTDTDVNKNPLMIAQEQLSNLGFKRVLMVNSTSCGIKHQASVHGDESFVEVSPKIDKIDGQCSAMTTIYIQHHIDTIMRMKNYVFKAQTPKKTLSSIVRSVSGDSSVQDLEQLEQTWKKEQQLRKTEQDEFMSRTVNFLETKYQGMVKTLVVKQFEIKEVSFSILSGDDFCFGDSWQAPLLEPIIIQLNDMNEVQSSESVPQLSTGFRGRFRIKNVDKYTNIRVVALGISLGLCKYRPKIQNQQLTNNMRAVFRVKTLACIVNKIYQDIFYLLKTSQRMSIVFEIQGTKIKAKHFLPQFMYIGYTSNINFLWKERQQAKTRLTETAHLVPIEDSEDIDIESCQTIYQVLAQIPVTKLILNVQMIGWKFIKNQQINTLQLFFHNKISKYLEEDNNKIIMKWIKDTLTNNMGSILSKGFLTLFQSAVWFLLSCVKQSILFPRTVFKVLRRR